MRYLAESNKDDHILKADFNSLATAGGNPNARLHSSPIDRLTH